MLASVKSLVIVLFCVLATLQVVSASCRELKRDDRFTEYCCTCTEKGWFVVPKVNGAATLITKILSIKSKE
ncbi:hypothetical protein V8B55DRAFT_1393483 [Mucor lusitanicus]|uniref:Uncharacterized protein n=1 Tax=Mucor lusitanicus CBS 277.49 TaxID=747725 RepID=A0A168NLV6_MUCCL|nr:hypothetical protein MUCCIDRAFT_107026 [Mucor lusitanicus CBS 277.49]